MLKLWNYIKIYLTVNRLRRFMSLMSSCHPSCQDTSICKKKSMRKRKKRRKKGKFIYVCFHCQHSIMSKSGCVLIDCPPQKAAIPSAAWPLLPRDGAGSCAGRHPARSVCIARPCSYRPEDTRHSTLELQTILCEDFQSQGPSPGFVSLDSSNGFMIFELTSQFHICICIQCTPIPWSFFNFWPCTWQWYTTKWIISQ